MTGPLKLASEVACSAEHAFTVWTSGVGTWWPPDHTVTGQANLVVLESSVGGRERLAAGQEWRDQNIAGWQGLLPHFVAAIAEGGS